MPTLDFVVASYREQFDWPHQFENRPETRVFVYNTGDLQLDYQRVTHLPNVGREMSQYLWHLLHYYGDFADHTLFTQAHPFDRCNDFLELLNTQEYAKSDWYPFGYIDTFYPGQARPFFMDKSIDLYVELQKTHWKLKGRPLPVKLQFCHGAVFSVSKQRLMSHTRAYYQQLYDEALRTAPISPWVFECLWEELL